MHIECTHHVDASELDEAGYYKYYYEYDLYRFTDEPICFVARSYTDEPDEVHFLRVEEDGRPRIMVNADLTHPVCLAAQAHLLAIGKKHLRWLGGRDGYGPLPSSSSPRT